MGLELSRFDFFPDIEEMDSIASAVGLTIKKHIRASRMPESEAMLLRDSLDPRQIVAPNQ